MSRLKDMFVNAIKNMDLATLEALEIESEDSTNSVEELDELSSLINNFLDEKQNPSFSRTAAQLKDFEDIYKSKFNKSSLYIRVKAVKFKIEYMSKIRRIGLK